MSMHASAASCPSSESVRRLCPRQAGLSAVSGAVLWAIAVAYIRFVGPEGGFAGVWGPVLYLATILLTWRAILRTQQVIGATKGQLVEMVLVMTAAATVLDGIAFSWVRGLYGHDPAVLLDGAAWLLFAIAVGLVLARRMSAPARASQRAAGDLAQPHPV